MSSPFDPQVKLLPTCSESDAVSAGTKILPRSVWELMYLECFILLHRHFQLASENQGTSCFNSSLTVCSQFDPHVRLSPSCSELAAV